MLVLRHYGTPFSLGLFIPFIGASVLSEKSKNIYQDAIVALGGPVLGSAAALAIAGYGAYTGDQFMLALADFGLLINFANLLPMRPFDGGRVTVAVSPWLNLVGVGMAGRLAYSGVFNNPLIYLYLISGTVTTFQEFMGGRDDEAPPEYKKINRSDQASLLLMYTALVAALFYAMKFNNKNRLTPKQLEARQRGDMVEVNHDGGALYDEIDFEAYFGIKEEDSPSTVRCKQCDSTFGVPVGTPKGSQARCPQCSHTLTV